MAGKNYEFIEHTADICIRVKGATLEDLFKNTALAMFEIIAEEKSPPHKNLEKIILEQKAENIDELFINWLNELLSLSSAKELVFSSFKIEIIDQKILKAEAHGSSYKDYNVLTEIKAATYHELTIKKVPSGWEAQVIFDV